MLHLNLRNRVNLGHYPLQAHIKWDLNLYTEYTNTFKDMMVGLFPLNRQLMQHLYGALKSYV